MYLFSQIAGWIGTVLIVSMYFLDANKKIDNSSKTGSLINLLGAVGIGINVFYQQAWPAFVLQIVWGVIAVEVLVKNLIGKKEK